jgi:hypothetical protein
MFQVHKVSSRPGNGLPTQHDPRKSPGRLGGWSTSRTRPAVTVQRMDPANLSNFIQVYPDRLGLAASAPAPLRNIMLRRGWAEMQIATVQQWEMSFLSIDMAQGLTPVAVDAPPSYVIVQGALPVPPPQIALLAADAVHSMRASLDYLARQLVIASDKEPEDKVSPKTSFPIMTTKPDGKGLPFIPPSVDKEIRKVVGSVQPYNDGADCRKNPLYILDELANYDKHRLLNVAVIKAGYTISGLQLASGEVLPINRTLAWERRTGSQEVARIPVEKVEAVDRVISNEQFGFVGWETPVEGSDESPVSQTLIRIFEMVYETVLPKFYTFLVTP